MNSAAEMPLTDAGVGDGDGVGEGVLVGLGDGRGVRVEVGQKILSIPKGMSPAGVPELWRCQERVLATSLVGEMSEVGGDSMVAGDMMAVLADPE